MRGNTNPCSVCQYCDDSCDVCLHQPYEHTLAWRYCEASSDDEGARSGGDGASTDVDSGSDEEGSWFTTPWSKLITQRVAGYEIDPSIGVQLAPLEDEEEEEEKHEQRAKEGRHRRRAAQEEGAAAQEEEEEGQTRGRQRRLRRRRRRRRGDSPAAAPEPTAADDTKDAGKITDEPVVANGEVLPADPVGAEPPANDEACGLFSEAAAQPANAQVPPDQEGDAAAAVPKNTHNNMWRATVHSYVSVVSVS